MSNIYIIADTHKDVSKAAKFGEIVTVLGDSIEDTIYDLIHTHEFDADTDSILLVGRLEELVAGIAILINAFQKIKIVTYNPHTSDYYLTHIG